MWSYSNNNRFFRTIYPENTIGDCFVHKIPKGEIIASNLWVFKEGCRRFVFKFNYEHRLNLLHLKIA